MILCYNVYIKCYISSYIKREKDSEFMNESYEILRRGLETAGIRSGDVLVVHSSLKSMGMVQGGAEFVLIDSVALKEKALKK